jgi:tetratricopeptide (TPR) repeat protein
MSAETLVSEGDALAAFGDLESAIEKYSAAIEADARCAEAWYGRALAREKHGDVDGATGDLRKAVELRGWAAREEAVKKLEVLEAAAAILPTAQRDFGTRRRFRELNRDVLTQLPDDRLEAAIVDYVTGFKIKGETAREYEIVKTLTPAFGWIYAMRVVEEEVHKAGFDDFFSGPRSDFALEAYDGYRAVGASKHAALLSRALAAVTGQADGWVRAEYRAAIEAFRKAGAEGLDAMTDEFKALPDVIAQKNRYVRGNPDQFFGA